VAAAIDDERRKSGIGSTVLDCTGFAPRILREGAVTAGDIAAALGRIGLAQGVFPLLRGREDRRRT
jgi:tRNA A37 threonylcarbamoyladenosine synthetase subunit TsaC/SUA5/YrdC